MVDVRLDDRQRRLPRASRILKAMTRRVVEAELDGVEEVDVLLADDVLLAELNARYRDKNRTTDVLAFPGSGPGPFAHLGEVVISTDRAVDQAPRYSHGVADEVARLLVHGLLHLAGYEHDSKAGRRAMRRAEERHIAHLEPWIEKLRTRYEAVPS